MHSLDSLIDDPHLAAVGFVEATEHPSEGQINTLRLPVTWSKSETRPSRPAPNLGEHGREVLGECGFSGDEIDSLLGTGVVGGWPASAHA
jgi:crotonobetainyl-CoA:carnitine CoA-transferase CaiB-like acyl-CoA transferase